MKIKLNNKNYELKLTADAVEKIEDNYDLAFDEIFAKEKRLRAREVIFILHSMLVESDLSLEEFKKLISLNYTYEETIALLTAQFETDPKQKRTDTK